MIDRALVQNLFDHVLVVTRPPLAVRIIITLLQRSHNDVDERDNRGMLGRCGDLVGDLWGSSFPS